MDRINWDEHVETVLRDPLVRQGVGVARRHGAKEVYVAGDAVFRKLVSEVYETPQNIPEVDIVVNSLAYPLQVRAGWQVHFRTDCEQICKGPGHVPYSNQQLRFTNNGKHINLISLEHLPHAKQNGSSALPAYLRSRALTMHSIGIDVENESIWGQAGIDALDNRIVAINNMAEAEYVARMVHHTDLETYLRQQAKSVGFGYALIDVSGDTVDSQFQSRLEIRLSNKPERKSRD